MTFRSQTKTLNNLINHVVLVLDASSSMAHLRNDVVKVADNEIQYLAKRSKELDQETRVSVYVFADRVDCLVYDTDVLRLPSIADIYRPNGMTALVDATTTAIEELGQTATLHGDHSFLLYVLTDGHENASRTPAYELQRRIGVLPENWTLACFVPDPVSKRDAVSYGFHKDNVAVWDTSSVRGIEDVANTVRTATESWMTNRSSGIRGTRSLFSTGADAVNAQTVSQSGLTPLRPGEYEAMAVHQKEMTSAFVSANGLRYVNGTVYYQLMKTETIQAQKEVLVAEKRTNKVFSGRQARQLIGLPDGVSVRVKPDYNPDYDIYVQSTAPNRNLIPGTICIVLNPIPSR